MYVIYIYIYTHIIKSSSGAVNGELLRSGNAGAGDYGGRRLGTMTVTRRGYAKDSKRKRVMKVMTVKKR